MAVPDDEIAIDDEDRSADEPARRRDAVGPFATAWSSSASSGMFRLFSWMKRSCESTDCGEIPTSSTPKPAIRSELSRYEQNCFVQTVVKSPG